MVLPTFLLSFLLSLPAGLLQTGNSNCESNENGNKEIPVAIQEEVDLALKYFPQLKEVPIAFRFRENISNATMLAQPSFWNFLRPDGEKAYVIYISKYFETETGEVIKITDVDTDVLLGWLGHELGHIMDYCGRSNLEMAWFGLKYLCVPEFVKEAERKADVFAVECGMADYLCSTKDFILCHESLSEEYKERIREFYLSPEEIMELLEASEVTVPEEAGQ